MKLLMSQSWERSGTELLVNLELADHDDPEEAVEIISATVVVDLGETPSLAAIQVKALERVQELTGEQLQARRRLLRPAE